MSRLTVRLPESLHQQLVHLAEKEGISLNQFIVYALTCQVAPSYRVIKIAEEKVAQQRENLESLLTELGEATEEEIQEALEQREEVNPEEDLNTEIIANLRQKISNSLHKKSPRLS